MAKKAIAPLISTVILLLFAIALGLLVMSWGNSYTNGENAAECSDVSLNLQSIEGKELICYKSNKIFFTVENDGAAVINGLRIIVIGEEGISDQQEEFILGIGDIKKGSLGYGNAGKIQKVKLEPVIGSTEGLRPCPKQGVEMEQIGECA